MHHLRHMDVLAIGSRLKRMSELCMTQAAEVYRQAGLDFEPRWFALLSLLANRPHDAEPMTLSDAATALGQSHAAVSQVASAMAKAGLLKLAVDKADRRARRMLLTAKGKDQIAALKPCWEAIRDGVADMLGESRMATMATLAALEDTLEQQGFVTSAVGRIKEAQQNAVKIMPWNKAWKQDFEALNRVWLERHFKVEKIDEALFKNPEKLILAEGGEIWFALIDGEVVGTCALIKTPEGMELAKMGVAEKARGRQVGRMLVQHAIMRAHALGYGRAKKGKKTPEGKLYLLTHHALQPAMRLYASMGFRQVPCTDEDRAHYARADVRMEWQPVSAMMAEGNPDMGEHLHGRRPVLV